VVASAPATEVARPTPGYTMSRNGQVMLCLQNKIPHEVIAPCAGISRRKIQDIEDRDWPNSLPG
jgi:hypothetical protein